MNNGLASTLRRLLDEDLTREQRAEAIQRCAEISSGLILALKSYVSEAASHADQGKPGSPFALRLAAARKVLLDARG